MHLQGPGLGTPHGSAHPVSAPPHLNEGLPAGLSLSSPRGLCAHTSELTLVVTRGGLRVGPQQGDGAVVLVPAAWSLCLTRVSFARLNPGLLFKTTNTWGLLLLK